jgi:acyl carrier protein
VSDEDDFHASGGDSLLGAELMQNLGEALHAELPPDLPTRAGTLGRLAEAVTELVAEPGSPR